MLKVECLYAKTDDLFAKVLLRADAGALWVSAATVNWKATSSIGTQIDTDEPNTEEWRHRKLETPF